MGLNSQLINYLNKFSQLFHFLNEYTHLRNLWMTTTDLWNSNERRLLCYLKLNKNKSLEYWNSKKFRTIIISRVTDPKKQISLDFSNSKVLKNVSKLGNVYELDLSECQGISDVSSLGNVHTLNLTRCTGITDVSSLGNVHTFIH